MFGTGRLSAVRLALATLGSESFVSRGAAARFAVLLQRGRRVVVEP